MWVAWLLCVLGVQASTLDIAGVRMAQVIDGRINIALPTDKDDLSGIRWRRSGSEDSPKWTAGFSAASHAGVKVGDSFTVQSIRSGAVSAVCTVESFVVRSLGYDSWSDPASTEPTCGTPQVHARTDCRGSGEGVYLATPPGRIVSAISDLSAVESRAFQPSSTLLRDQQLQSFASTARSEHRGSDARRARLRGEYKQTPLAGHRNWSLIGVQWLTGQGEWRCGGPDFSSEGYGIWNGKRIISDLHDPWLYWPVALFSIDQRYFLVVNDQSRTVIMDDQGDTHAASYSMFCGCSC